MYFVFSQLQDLAISPRIQDPTLNTAECVIKGHETDIDATGRGPYIRAMLWCSCIFTILFGPLLALNAFIFFNKADETGKKPKNENQAKAEIDETEEKEKKQNLAKAVKCTSCFLLLVEIALLVAVIAYLSRGNAPPDICVILGLICVEGFIMGLAIRKEYFTFLPENKISVEFLVKLTIFLWANLTTYHFCWLVIGIMINTLWGFTVLLVICVVIAATVYSVFTFICFYELSTRRRSLILFGASLCSVLSLVALVILAGQSFFGRETANEVVKTALLYVTTAFISWIFPKIKEEEKPKKSDEKTKGKETEENTPLTEMKP